MHFLNKKIYVVTICLVFGEVDEVNVFLTKEQADTFILEWTNLNAPECVDLFTSSIEALDWMSDNTERMEYTIQLFELEI